MNKLEFSKLKNKEDMIMVFNQLKDDYRQLFAINEDLQEENERLNNVINGLEKDLEKVFSKMEEKQVEIDGRGYYYTDLIPVDDVLDKLKELKEGEKDEI